MGGLAAPVRRRARGCPAAFERGQTMLAGRLEIGPPEIDRAVMTRVYMISDPTKVADPEYVVSLRARSLLNTTPTFPFSFSSAVTAANQSTWHIQLRRVGNAVLHHAKRCKALTIVLVQFRQ